jgi:AraC-like DNA-binding protein
MFPIDSRLAHVLAYIADHGHQPLTLAELAQVAHLSRTHFSTTFRGAAGLAPFEYVHRHRLQRAKELLADESLGVAEVAARVGFADPFYFSRAFKRTEGLSQRQYRLAKQSPAFP